MLEKEGLRSQVLLVLVLFAVPLILPMFTLLFLTSFKYYMQLALTCCMVYFCEVTGTLYIRLI